MSTTNTTYYSPNVPVGPTATIYTTNKEAVTLQQPVPDILNPAIRLDGGPASDEKTGLVKIKHFQCLNIAASGIRSFYSGIGTCLKHLSHPIFKSLSFSHICIPAPVIATAGKIYSALGVPMEYVKGFAILGIPFGFIKLIGNVKKATLHSGWKRVASAMKATRAMSVLLDSTVKSAIGLEAFKFSAELGKNGYLLAERAIKVIVNWSTPLGIISSILSSATLAVDILSLRKSKDFLETINAELGQNGEVYSSELITRMVHAAYSPRFLKKTFFADGETLKVVCQDRLADKELVEQLKYRVETVVRHKKITALATTINLLSTLLIFTNFLHPLGYVGLGVYGGLTVINLVDRQISAYHFERKMGMIEGKPTDPKYLETNLLWRIADFIKWSFYFHSYKKIQPTGSTSPKIVE